MRLQNMYLHGVRPAPLRPALAAVMLIAVVLLLSQCAQRMEREGVAEYSSERVDFRLVEVTAPLTNPWAISFLPDGRGLVTERGGQLYILEDEELLEVDGVPRVSAVGQGGLLDVAVHPDFEDNGLVYFSYSIDGDRTGTAIGRGELRGTTLENFEQIFVQNRLSTGGQHFGSRILFLDDRTLVATIGDRGDRDRAQATDDHAGSLVRLNDDGSVPEDNPWVGVDGYAPELYVTGSRNSQGLAMHPETGVLWQHEHGPRGGDELNIIEAGANYGWPVVSHGTEYMTGEQIGEGTHAGGMTPPVAYWSPAIAPSGMAFYNGEAFPEWQSDLFIGSLVDSHLLRIELDEGVVVHEERLLDDIIGRIRDVEVGPNDYLYVIADEGSAPVYRLEPVDE